MPDWLFDKALIPEIMLDNGQMQSPVKQQLNGHSAKACFNLLMAKPMREYGTRPGFAGSNPFISAASPFTSLHCSR
jgi:hypothetical protein